MYLRTLSSLRILTSFSSIISIHQSISTTFYYLRHRIPYQSQRTFMFWRANVNRELYGTPNKALATRKRRRLAKKFNTNYS